MSSLEPPTAGPRSRAAAGAALCALAVALCYANSLSVPFLLDDPRPGTVFDYRTRPLVWASFALNARLGGGATAGYHAFNALVHLGCGLLLSGVVRRGAAAVAPELAPRTRDGLALATALLWLVHPLGTAAVTYLSQRAESIAAFFTLAALYGFLRHRAEPALRLWPLLTLAALVLGFLTKETGAVTPVLLLLAELALPEHDAPGSWRRRRVFHGAALALSAALFFLLVVPSLTGARSAGFAPELGFGPFEYARSQAGVVLHYLRLALWPHPLVFDYAWPIARAAGDWLPQGAALGALLLATLVLLRRRSWIGFAAAAFFALLAPTSSVVPIRDLAFEHRAYLPLASVVVLALAGGRWLCARTLPGVRALPAGLVVATILALGATTVLRNREYASAETLWRTVIARAPHNERAYTALGVILLDAGRTAEARAALEKAVELDPTSELAHTNLGACLQREGRFDEARVEFESAIRLNPKASKAYQNLGTDSLRRGALAEAAGYFELGLAAADTLALHYYLGQVRCQLGDLSAARKHLERALELEPRDALAHVWLGNVLARQNETAEAERHYREALRLDPREQEAHINLAVLLAGLGRQEEALAEDLLALAIEPNSAAEHFNHGQQCLALGRFDEALAAFRRATALAQEMPEAFAFEAEALSAKPGASQAELDEALRLAEKANALAGGKRATVIESLAKVRAARGVLKEACALLEAALALPGPTRNPAYAATLRARLEEYRSRGAAPR